MSEAASGFGIVSNRTATGALSKASVQEWQSAMMSRVCTEGESEDIARLSELVQARTQAEWNLHSYLAQWQRQKENGVSNGFTAGSNTLAHP